MNKFILALTLTLLTPFFSTANIFTDGSVNTSPQESKTTATVQCGLDSGTLQTDSLYLSTKELASMCTGKIATKIKSTPAYSICDSPRSRVIAHGDSYYVEVKWTYSSTGTRCDYEGNNTQLSSGSYAGQTTIESCPEEAPLSYEVDGEVVCYSALAAQQGDSCDFNDVYPRSNGSPTSVNVCVAKPNGSVCAVTPQTTLDGVDVYTPTEEDCYSSNDNPVVDENSLNDLPDGADQQCTESEGLTYCPADPSVVCPNGQCETGCGQMNGVFICLTPTETPPCTGDDCGTETPPCTGDDCGTETPPCTGDDCEKKEEGFCDEEGNCDTSIVARKDPSEGLKSFWKTDYPDGLGGVVDSKLIDLQTTEFYTFIESFNPTLGAGNAPPMQICFNLGALGNYGCQGFKIDSRVYPAIRIFILITAGFLCRKILFGG